MSGNGVDADVRERILATYHDRLRGAGSPIVGNPVWLAQATHQAAAVLDDVGEADLSVLPWPFPQPVVGRDNLSAEIGGTRAMTGLHPAESLYAASVLFTTVLEELAAAHPGNLVALSEVLHHSIMRRIGVATISYASFLLSKVHRSHLEERQRMARELHDRAAHAVGVGLQNLELHDTYEHEQPERAKAKLQAARDALHEALHTVRALSAELRRAVGTDGLVTALDRYLEANVPPGIDVRFTTRGDDHRLPSVFSEEIYLVVREAVRNALVHANPKRIDVGLEVDASGLYGVVRDDGEGFDVPVVAHAREGVGLTSMRDRMTLLGGTLTVTSSKGKGTVVEVRVDLPDVAE